VSRLNDLIQKLCPDGVRFIPLGDLLDYEQPGRYLVGSTSYDERHLTPVLTAGQTFVLGYTDETGGIYQASSESPVVIFDDFTAASKWVDFPFKAKSSAMKMLTAKPGADASLRYAFYSMQTIAYAPQDHARQWIGTYSQFRIPVPPVPVQDEIVRVLSLFDDLDDALRKELEARRRQFAYYREQLMAFRGASGVKWTPMGEIGRFTRGRRFTKDDIVEDGIPSIHYGEIYTKYGTATRTTVSRVRRDLSGRLRFAAPDDVVIATVGETVEDVAKAVAWLGNEPVAIHDDTLAFHSDMNPRFVSYAMQTAAFHAQKTQYVARAKVKRIGAEDLAKILIPVPSSIDEQGRVAAVLEDFEVLVNDPSAGLPAEIKARRAQFEYYRDKLLTFHEAAI
jgi:type I restriction enzyme S subunit